MKAKIAWLLVDSDYNTIKFLKHEPRYYSGTLTKIVYFEVEDNDD